MAERSKAPDSKLITFQAHNGTGRSGLLMEARVRITHLTMSLFRTRSLSGPFLVSSVLVYHEIQRPCIECSVGQYRLRTCSYHTQLSGSPNCLGRQTRGQIPSQNTMGAGVLVSEWGVSSNPTPDNMFLFFSLFVS